MSSNDEKGTSKARGRKKRAAKPPDPADVMEGPGRRPKLTRKLLDQLCEDLKTGVSQQSALTALFVTRETKRQWLLTAEEHRTAGVESLYVEFSDRVKPAIAQGEVEYFRVAKLATKTGNPKDVQKARVAERMIRLRFGGKYLRHERVEQQTAADSAMTEAAALPADVDFSRLTDEEFEELQKAHAKMQALLAKARGVALPAKS